jgi:hypothetical protein
MFSIERVATGEGDVLCSIYDDFEALFAGFERSIRRQANTVRFGADSPLATSWRVIAIHAARGGSRHG